MDMSKAETTRMGTRNSFGCPIGITTDFLVVGTTDSQSQLHAGCLGSGCRELGGLSMIVIVSMPVVVVVAVIMIVTMVVIMTVAVVMIVLMDHVTRTGRLYPYQSQRRGAVRRSQPETRLSPPDRLLAEGRRARSRCGRSRCIRE